MLLIFIPCFIKYDIFTTEVSALRIAQPASKAPGPHRVLPHCVRYHALSNGSLLLNDPVTDSHRMSLKADFLQCFASNNFHKHTGRARKRLAVMPGLDTCILSLLNSGGWSNAHVIIKLVYAGKAWTRQTAKARSALTVQDNTK